MIVHSLPTALKIYFTWITFFCIQLLSWTGIIKIDLDFFSFFFFYCCCLNLFYVNHFDFFKMLTLLIELLSFKNVRKQLLIYSTFSWLSYIFILRIIMFFSVEDKTIEKWDKKIFYKQRWLWSQYVYLFPSCV